MGELSPINEVHFIPKPVFFGVSLLEQSTNGLDTKCTSRDSSVCGAIQ